MENTNNIDYIRTDHETMVDFHGKYTFLEGDNKLDLFETGAIINNITNPLTGKYLTFEELEYVKFHYGCYKHTNNLLLSMETLQNFFRWYSDSRRLGIARETLQNSPNTREAYNIVRYYLTAVDFESHFRNFDPQNSDKEAYERDLAEKALIESQTVGKWLLRHSSKNRPVNVDEQNRLQRLGIRYYALSYVDRNMKIKHVLITYQVGKGWYNRTWYTNFLDVVEATLLQQGLRFNQQIFGYIQDDNE